jgi:anaerobic selenocysteine-containing dehydrogenase
MDIKKNNTIDRREFIEISSKGAAGISLTSFAFTSGCGTDKTPKTVHGACYHDCPDRCSWNITTVDNTVTSFKANANNPYTAGNLCDKMMDFPNDVTFHSDRILTPLKRSGAKGSGEFVKISWKQAITEVAARLKDIIAQKGGEAVLPYSFGGNQGLVQFWLQMVKQQACCLKILFIADISYYGVPILFFQISIYGLLLSRLKAKEQRSLR